MNKKSFYIITIYFIFSISLSLTGEQAVFTVGNASGSTSFVNTTITSDAQVISFVLNSMSQEEVQGIVPYLSTNAIWNITGNSSKICFAGTFIGRSNIEYALREYFNSITINQLIIESTTATSPGSYISYIRLQGNIPSTSKIFDVEYKYNWQFNTIHEIIDVNVSYAVASMELAFTQGGEGKVISDVSPSPQSLAIVNSLLPVKGRIGNPETPLANLRSPYTAPALPADGSVEQVNIAGITGDLIHITGERTDKIIFHMHGGGFISGVPARYRIFDYTLGKAVNIPVLNINYGWAPENPFPGPIEDCYNTYKELLKKYDPGNIIFIGDSAGGNLVFAVMLLAKQNNIPLPGAVLALSPFLDLTQSGETMVTNAENDTYIPLTYVIRSTNWYLNGASGLNPLASPLFGDLTDLPPVYLSASTTEILLSDSTRMFTALSQSNVDVTIEIASDLCHVFAAICIGTTDFTRSITRMAGFITNKLNLN